MKNDNDDVAGKQCSYQSDCGGAGDNFYCEISTRRCMIKKPLGQACTADYECAEGTCSDGTCHNMATIVQTAKREADKEAARAARKHKKLRAPRVHRAVHLGLSVLVFLVVVAAVAGVALYLWKRSQRRKRREAGRAIQGTHPSTPGGGAGSKEKAGKITQSPMFVMPAAQPPTYSETLNEMTPEEPPPHYQSPV